MPIQSLFCPRHLHWHRGKLHVHLFWGLHGRRAFNRVGMLTYVCQRGLGVKLHRVWLCGLWLTVESQYNVAHRNKHLSYDHTGQIHLNHMTIYIIDVNVSSKGSPNSPNESQSWWCGTDVNECAKRVLLAPQMAHYNAPGHMMFGVNVLSVNSNDPLSPLYACVCTECAEGSPCPQMVQAS